MAMGPDGSLYIVKSRGHVRRKLGCSRGRIGDENRGPPDNTAAKEALRAHPGDRLPHRGGVATVDRVEL